MNEIKRKDMNSYLKYLNEKKCLIGLDGWVIFLSDEYKNLGDVHAEATSNIYDKTIKIDLSTEFLNMSEQQQKNVLMHELVHSRISIYNEEISELIRVREEHLVNDLTKGYEGLL